MALSPTEESLVRQLIAQNPALLNLASSENTIISKLGATKVNLSDLSAATSLSDADLALVRQGLNDKSFAMSVLLDYVENNLTLPTASETVAGVVEIATAAEAQAFTADKVIDGAKLAAAFGGANQGLTESGYQKLPGGLIIQWGVTTPSGGSQSISLPISFPNSFFFVVAQIADTNIGTYGFVSGVKTSNSAFTLTTRRNDGAADPYLTSWVAIGY